MIINNVRSFLESKKINIISSYREAFYRLESIHEDVDYLLDRGGYNDINKLTFEQPEIVFDKLEVDYYSFLEEIVNNVYFDIRHPLTSEQIDFICKNFGSNPGDLLSYIDDSKTNYISELYNYKNYINDKESKNIFTLFMSEKYNVGSIDKVHEVIIFFYNGIINVLPYNWNDKNEFKFWNDFSDDKKDFDMRIINNMYSEKVLNYYTDEVQIFNNIKKMKFNFFDENATNYIPFKNVEEIEDEVIDIKKFME